MGRRRRRRRRWWSGRGIVSDWLRRSPAMNRKASRRTTVVFGTLILLSVVLVVWLRLHAKPVRLWFGNVGFITSPAVGVAIVTWSARQPGTGMEFNQPGIVTTLNFAMVTGNPHIRAKVQSPRDAIRWHPQWYERGGTVTSNGVASRIGTAYVPLWWLPLLPAGVWHYVVRRARRLATLRLCPRCRYDLSGLSSDTTCPECGKCPAPSSGQS
jgi:hypothetical protein